MTNADGEWARVPMPGGGERWDWVPADQPDPPDGVPGRWHVVAGGPGRESTWEFFPAYAYAPAPGGWAPAPEPLASRARLATIFLGLALAASAVVVVLDIVEVSLLNPHLDDPAGGIDDVHTRDNLAAVGVAVWALAWIPSAVFFIRWLHLAYRNLDLLAPGVRRHGVGWSIGSWFVPFLNLWRPKQIVEEVNRGTGGAADGLITRWWVVWVVGSFVGNMSVRGIFGADTLEDYRNADVADAFVSGLQVASGVLAILVVRAVTASYEARAAAVAQPAPAGPPQMSGWPHA